METGKVTDECVGRVALGANILLATKISAIISQASSVSGLRSYRPSVQVTDRFMFFDLRRETGNQLGFALEQVNE